MKTVFLNYGLCCIIASLILSCGNSNRVENKQSYTERLIQMSAAELHEEEGAHSPIQVEIKQSKEVYFELPKFSSNFNITSTAFVKDNKQYFLSYNQYPHQLELYDIDEQKYVKTFKLSKDSIGIVEAINIDENFDIHLYSSSRFICYHLDYNAKLKAKYILSNPSYCGINTGLNNAFFYDVKRKAYYFTYNCRDVRSIPVEIDGKEQNVESCIGAFQCKTSKWRFYVTPYPQLVRAKEQPAYLAYATLLDMKDSVAVVYQGFGAGIIVSKDQSGYRYFRVKSQLEKKAVRIYADLTHGIRIEGAISHDMMYCNTVYNPYKKEYYLVHLKQSSKKERKQDELGPDRRIFSVIVLDEALRKKGEFIPQDGIYFRLPLPTTSGFMLPKLHPDSGVPESHLAYTYFDTVNK